MDVYPEVELALPLLRILPRFGKFPKEEVRNLFSQAPWERGPRPIAEAQLLEPSREDLDVGVM